ncbi:hypothetical protein AQI95_43680 [Streptomyces yokosukanensis]|uniref:Uncharacterized protein n=1 Tax=Streptomyces yokosukanensis TaxID=67386 RepID=A0A101NJ97_9ACTN|nr:hypothetical protein AQI95_43680 [Streptomyces yokosukanensis]
MSTAVHLYPLAQNSEQYLVTRLAEDVAADPPSSDRYTARTTRVVTASLLLVLESGVLEYNGTHAGRDTS